jgi:hypothetical protein
MTWSGARLCFTGAAMSGSGTLHPTTASTWMLVRRARLRDCIEPQTVADT